MKLHYTSGHFYIEKDGKKIKIANPELLYPLTIYGEMQFVDLPKELSVEIKDACDSDCCTMDGACGSNCRSPLKIAILSKSSSPEGVECKERIGTCTNPTCMLHNKCIDHINKIERNKYQKAMRNTNSAKNWTEDFAHENGNYINRCHKCDEYFKGHKRRVICKECASSPEIPDSSEKALIDRIEEFQSQFDESDIQYLAIEGLISWLRNDDKMKPPTVAGTSTELKSDSVISNNSEKPDFEDIAEKHFESKGLWYGELNTWERAAIESLLKSVIIPRDKTISDLRERVKELEERL